jgi:hypothetical protein
MKSHVWLYPGETAAWHFITLPQKDSVAIKKTFGAGARGFGSLPVVAKIGKTTWESSIFPDRHSGSYLLPLKASIRKKEDLMKGDAVSFSITIRQSPK